MRCDASSVFYQERVIIKSCSNTTKSHYGVLTETTKSRNYFVRNSRDVANCRDFIVVILCVWFCLTHVSSLNVVNMTSASWFLLQTPSCPRLLSSSLDLWWWPKTLMSGDRGYATAVRTFLIVSFWFIFITVKVPDDNLKNMFMKLNIKLLFNSKFEGTINPNKTSSLL